MNQKHSHYGHRQRKKEFVLNYGIDGLKDHEKLEVFLYGAIPHGDTNEIAHELMQKFGDFVGVITAKYDDLLEVKGIGKHTAFMIHAFKLCARHYIMEQESRTQLLKNTESLNAYCAATFLGVEKEEIRCLFLDNELYLIENKKICEGGFGKVEISRRGFLQEIFKLQSNRIVLTHNHPFGSCIPSKADVDVTRDLYLYLKDTEIELIDHVISGKDGIWSMRERDTFPDIW
jgi:DNA repair protein RadC